MTRVVRKKWSYLLQWSGWLIEGSNPSVDIVLKLKPLSSVKYKPIKSKDNIIISILNNNINLLFLFLCL